MSVTSARASSAANSSVRSPSWARSLMLVLTYQAEAVMRLFDAQPASRWCAAAALLCSSVFFIAGLRYVQLVRREAA